VWLLSSVFHATGIVLLAALDAVLHLAFVHSIWFRLGFRFVVAYVTEMRRGAG
jgi:hypothetical protein